MFKYTDDPGVDRSGVMQDRNREEGGFGVSGKRVGSTKNPGIISRIGQD